MVFIKKKNHKLRMHIDYKKFNKYIQKDHFFNSILNKVVDHKTYIFTDGYLSYNQIAIALKDHHEITFMTSYEGTFIFLVMLFGLCNPFYTF